MCLTALPTDLYSLKSYWLGLGLLVSFAKQLLLVNSANVELVYCGSLSILRGSQYISWVPYLRNITFTNIITLAVLHYPAGCSNQHLLVILGNYQITLSVEVEKVTGDHLP